MAKLTLADVVNLQSETTAVQVINANGDLIEAALENTLSRDGTSPNTMGANLDMNSHRVLNLPSPINATEPLRLGDIGGVLPADIVNAGSYAAAAAVSASDAAASAIAASGYVGAATQAPKWTTGRSITLTGDIIGTSPTWDGSANLTFGGTTIAAGVVTASKLASGAAVSNIGYTPANLTGAVFTGEVRLNYAATVVNTDSVGFRGIPVVTQNNDYAFPVDAIGRMIRHDSGSAHVWYINPVSIVAHPIGAAISLRNVGSGVVTIARDTGVTLRKAGSGTDANVTLAQWGLATVVHESSNVWVITGTGIA